MAPSNPDLPPDPTSDEVLVAGLLAGRPEVVERIRSWIRLAFGPYRQRLAEELEDMEQEILLGLTVGLRDGRFAGRSSLRTWVRAHVHHKCLDRARAHGRRQWVDLGDVELEDSAPSALDTVERDEASSLALRVLDQMPESCRELWRLLEAGASYKQMAERIGVAEGALRVRMKRCRDKAFELRRRLEAE
ncbi:MAG: sigma-70 family RNA polymerase sigma factor [Acidobacteriota bacterium]